MVTKWRMLALCALAVVSVSACASSTDGRPVAVPELGTHVDKPAADQLSFGGVQVTGGKDLSKAPAVRSLGTADPQQLLAKDLVVGTGQAATPSSTVSVQYVGVLYRTGAVFDSSWSRGAPASFPLAQVVPGFAQAIGGSGAIPAMRVGGRRIMIIPASLGYGSQANGAIPANSALVFVVDLKGLSG